MRNQSSFHTKLSTEEQHYLKNNVFIRETLKTKKPCILNGCRAFWARNLECFPALLTKIQMPKTKGCHDGQPFRLFFSCGSFISGWCFTFWFCVRRCFRIFFFCRIFFLCIVGIICRIVLASCGRRCCSGGIASCCCFSQITIPLVFQVFIGSPGGEVVGNLLRQRISFE